jgi:polyisoprenoid-binding protein YceI
MRKYLIPAAIAIVMAGSATLYAQGGKPGSADVSKVTGGTYQVDGGHTQVLFAYDHMGFSNNMGVIAGPTGTLTLDPKNASAATVSVEFPVANIRTGVAALDEHLLKPEFFDGAKFPTAKFVSTGVKVQGTTADITGNLTIKGITKPVTLDAQFYGVGANPMNKKENIGFSATTAIKRSDFGMGGFVPVVGDEIELKIVAAFQK